MEVVDLFGAYGARHAGRAPQHAAAGRDLHPRDQESPGTHEALCADLDPVEEHGADADEGVIPDHAPVDDRSVAHRHAGADVRRPGVARDVDRGIVLHVATAADADLLDVSADHRVEPYAHTGCEDHVADDNRPRGKVYVICERRGLASYRRNHGAAYTRRGPSVQRREVRMLSIRACLFAGILLAFSGSASGQEASTRAPSIKVLGRGEVSAAPDAVRITFAIESTAPTAAEAARDNATRAERVLETTRGMVAKGGKVSTLGYRLTPLYQEPEEPSRRRPAKPEVIGYRTENQVIVEARDLETAGPLIDAAVKAGADRVGGIQFELRDRTKALQEALGMATRDARAQADAVAAALGVRLGPVESASAVPEPIHFPFDRGAPMLRMAAAETPIEPGEISVQVTVEVRYRIAE